MEGGPCFFALPAFPEGRRAQSDISPLQLGHRRRRESDDGGLQAQLEILDLVPQRCRPEVGLQKGPAAHFENAGIVANSRRST